MLPIDLTSGARATRLRHGRIIVLLYAAEAAVLAGLIGAAWLSASGDVAAWVKSWPRLWNLCYAVTLVVAIVVGIRTYVRTHEPGDRQQLRFFVFGGVAAALLNVALTRIPVLIGNGELLNANARAALDISFPLLVATVLWGTHLQGLETLINRTIVYSGLTIVAALVYAGFVYAVGLAFPAQAALSPFVAAIVIAMAFNPLRQRAQQVLNRLMYGERDAPITVFRRMGERLQGAPVHDTMLNAIAETLADSLKLPYVCIARQDGDGWRVLAEHVLPGRQNPAPQMLNAQFDSRSSDGHWGRAPIVFQGKSIGVLLASPRYPGERLSKADHNLLAALSQPIGAVIQAMELTRDLRRSREQILHTREEERRRIGNDLHDGLGPTMAGMSFELGAARNLLVRDPGQADLVLSALQRRMQSSVEDIRRLVYALRPPILDQIGLVAAIAEQAATIQQAAAQALRIDVRAADALPEIPAAVETAAYHIAREAMLNVVKHAMAAQCVVTLHVRHEPAAAQLVLEVLDDGAGVQSGGRMGVGLSSMRERAGELGGTCDIASATPAGTRVCAVLPIG
jgi:signal transduction histidine kinase